MAEESFTGCIKLIDAEEICGTGENVNFWFDSPLRFGVWGYLKDRLPADAAKFATCESKANQPKGIICAAEAILLSDLFLVDSFGVVVYGSNAKAIIGDEADADNDISILIRVFAPAEIEPDNCKIVDLNILAMCVKRLLAKFSSEDLWQFEPTAKAVNQQIRLDRIESRSSDSGGALVRAAREFIDITAIFKVLEDLTETKSESDWIE